MVNSSPSGYGEPLGASDLAQEKQEMEAILAVIAAASASLELDKVLATALSKTMEVLGADSGSIHLLEEASGELVLQAPHFISPAMAAELRRLKLGQSLAGLAAQRGEPILTADLAVDPRATISAAAAEGLQSLAVAPIKLMGRVLGTIACATRKGQPPLTQHHLNLVQNIANAIAPAIEHARLYQRAREAAAALAREKQALEAVNSVVAAASASIELNLVLKLALEKTISVLGTDAGTIHLLEEGSGDLVLKAHHRLPLEAVRDIKRLKVANSIVGMAVERKEPVLVPDMTQEPRLATQATIQQGPRAMVVVPIKLHDRVLGTLTTAQAGAGSISPHNAKLMQAIANAVAPAIENARLYEQMETLALADTLTGLPNRRYLQGELEREVARSRREHVPLSLLMLDVDSLKSVNDQYGHEAGDHLLMELGAIFTGALRGSDIVVRYGGDEFVVALPGTGLDEAKTVARRLQQRVNAYRLQVREGKEIAAQVSIGIAIFPQQAASAGELLGRADFAVYRSKARGRNQITLYPDTPVPSSPGPSDQS